MENGEKRRKIKKGRWKIEDGSKKCGKCCKMRKGLFFFFLSFFFFVFLFFVFVFFLFFLFFVFVFVLFCFVFSSSFTFQTTEIC